MENSETDDNMVQISKLIPYQFTKENAAENARRAHKSRAENEKKKQHVRTELAPDIIRAQESLKKLGFKKLAEDISREDLPKASIAIMMDLALRVLGGEWDIKNAEEATKIAKTWHDILRLEMNQATTISGTQNETPESRQNRLEELRLEAKRRVEGNLRAIAGDA